MTAAHRPGAILTPRYRGARAVANFNAADARSRATHLRAGWLPSAGVGHCNSQTGRHGPEMPARRSSARPAAPFNGRNAQVDAPATAVPVLCSRHTREIDARPSTISNAASNERSPEPGRCLVSSEAPGCRGDAYTQPSPCEMTTHCMAKANAGEGGRHGCTHSDRQRPARFAAGLCRLPRPFSSL